MTAPTLGPFGAKQIVSHLSLYGGLSMEGCDALNDEGKYLDHHTRLAAKKIAQLRLTVEQALALIDERLVMRKTGQPMPRWGDVLDWLVQLQFAGEPDKAKPAKAEQGNDGPTFREQHGHPSPWAFIAADESGARRAIPWMFTGENSYPRHPLHRGLVEHNRRLLASGKQPTAMPFGMGVDRGQ